MRWLRWSQRDLVHVAWWQILIAIGFTLSTLDRGVVILEHLGLLPRQLLTWLQRRWLRRLEEKARSQALDSLLTNGITTKLDAVREQGSETAELLAEHLVDATEDRRLAAVDRQRLNELYEKLVIDGEV